MAKWFDSLDEMLEVAKKPAKIKNSHTNVVARLECEGRSFIVKRYNIKGFWHALSRCWRPSRAWVAWCNGNRLRFLGMATPQPIALIEKRFGPLRGVAYIIMQTIDGVPLSKLSTINQPHIKQTAQQILQLAAANISHGDMKASNFMVSDKDVYLIDLDSMKQHHSALVFKKMFKQDMERFMRNWQQQPEVAAAFQAELKSVM
jgi:tRNA A-37 threonylcarbamoyl transferase component Bud32